jgi:hypothetical protein
MRPGGTMKRLLAVVTFGWMACGGGDGATTAATATLVNGATALEMAAAVAPARDAFGAIPTSYEVTPETATLKLNKIQFLGGESGAESATLENCTATFDRTKPGLTTLSECPFAMPVGTFYGLMLYVDATVSVMIDDPVNGFFTTASGMTTTDPGSALAETAVTYTGTPAYGPDGFTSQTVFAQPLVVNEGDTVALSVVIDGLHAIKVRADGGSATILTDGAEVGHPDYVASVGTAAKVAYYLDASTPFTPTRASGASTSLKFFYSDATNPVMMFGLVQGQMAIDCTPSGMYGIGGVTNVNHETHPLNLNNSNGIKYGGYLGLDTQTYAPERILAWAVATDSSYTAFQGYYHLGEAQNPGDMTTLACKKTPAPPVPTSGDTYSVNCPNIDPPDGTLEMVLVAE